MTHRFVPTDLGCDLVNRQYWGVVKNVTAEKELLLRIHRPVDYAGYDGLASVHVYESDVDILGTGLENTNSRLVLEVSFASGDAGGGSNVSTILGRQPIFIDATRGAYFTVPGSNTIRVEAYLQSSVAGAPLSIFATKRVEASVHWRTSINPIKSRWSPPSISLTAGVPSAFVQIPRQAESMIALTNNPAALGTLTAHFATDNTGTSGPKYSVINPFVNSAPITSGVEFVRYTSTAGDHTILTSLFDLWL